MSLGGTRIERDSLAFLGVKSRNRSGRHIGLVRRCNIGVVV